MNVQTSRRTFAKALASSGTVASLSRLVPTESPVTGLLAMHNWEQVHPAVWRAAGTQPNIFKAVTACLSADASSIGTSRDVLALLSRRSIETNNLTLCVFCQTRSTMDPSNAISATWS